MTVFFLKNGSLLSEGNLSTIFGGVPIINYKTIIQILFGKTQLANSIKNYQSLFQIHIKNSLVSIKINSFREETAQIFRQPFMNKAGQQALKRVTYIISKTSGQLEYNPFILYFISILLIFVEESSAYYITRCLIESSFNTNEQNKQNLKFHLTLNKFQFQKLAQRFYKTVKKVSPTIKVINSHLNTEGIQKLQIFKDIVGSMFFGYLPFPVIMRIFIQYLNEGVEIFYRVYYAIIKISGPGIRDSTSTKQILRIIKSKMLTYLCVDQNITIFFRYAFDLRLETNPNIRMLQLESMRSRRSSDEGIYYLPTIIGDSEILSYLNIESIWSFLPTAIKHYDIRKVYPLDQDNDSLSLKNMLKSIADCNFTLIIIQSIKGEIFGVFIASKIKQAQHVNIGLSKFYDSTPNLYLDSIAQNNPTISKSTSFKQKKQNSKDMQYFGSSDSFVLTMLPKTKKFMSTGANIFYCTYNEHFFAIGGPASRPALQLDSTLSIGLSFQCPTYNNLPLHNGPPGQFRINQIQCFSIE